MKKKVINFMIKLNNLKIFTYLFAIPYLNCKNKKKPLLVSLSGGQGSGKSTIAHIFKIILEQNFKLKVVKFSIDDFYKTAKERKKMASKIHPLFITRGVPGTHDTKMLYSKIKGLMKKKI